MTERITEKHLAWERRINSVLLLFLIVVIAYASVRMKKSPADVYHLATTMDSKLDAIALGENTKMQRMQSQLDDRGVWIKDQSERVSRMERELYSRTQDRVYRSEILQLIIDTNIKNQGSGFVMPDLPKKQLRSHESEANQPNNEGE